MYVDEPFSAGIPPGQQFLSVKQVARALNVKHETIRRWLRTGRLVGMRLGGKTLGWRISADSLQAFVAQATREQRQAGKSK